MTPFYNAGIRLYSAAAHLVALRSDKVKRMLAGQHRTITRLRVFRQRMAPDGFDVWFHAASLGEFEQARPLIERLLAERPGIKILVSFFSPSGYDVRCHYDPRVAVVYMPFDLPGKVREFIDAAAPRMAIFVKYEFWGTYLSELHARKIPTYIISTIFRPKQRFFRPWGGIFRDILRNFDHFYVQDSRSARLLASIGITSVDVVGDTRFDRVLEICRREISLPEIELFANPDKKSSKPFMLVAGSSWERDEDIYIPWLKANSDVRAIIAPHEFDADRLYHLRSCLGSDKAVLLSDFRRLFATDPDGALKLARESRHLIVDCFGLLSTLYRFADMAYVGGGFGAGIHNINEAAVYGIPVLFGPRHQKFNEALDLKACGGGFAIDAVTFRTVADRMLGDTDTRLTAGKAAKKYILDNIGATPRILADLFDIKK